MMDSTTVDYAIGKLNEAFEKIAPTAIDLGEQYIGYVVLMLTVKVIAGLVLGIALVAIGALLIKKGIESDRANPSEDEPGLIPELVGVALVIFSFFALGISLLHLPMTIVANIYPLMYAIEHLVK